MAPPQPPPPLAATPRPLSKHCSHLLICHELAAVVALDVILS